MLQESKCEFGEFKQREVAVEACCKIK